MHYFVVFAESTVFRKLFIIEYINNQMIVKACCCSFYFYKYIDMALGEENKSEVAEDERGINTTKNI